MSRSRKFFPWTSGYFRSPRGRRNALRNNVRAGTVPPDSFDDIGYDPQCWLPQTVAKKLVEKGWSECEVISHLVQKYGVSGETAKEVVTLETKFR